LSRRRPPDIEQSSLLFDDEGRFKLETIALSKGLPANMDAERIILGACLSNYDSLSKVDATVAPEDFLLEKHKTIYACIQELFRGGGSVDMMSICNALEKKRKLTAVDGMSYLAQLGTDQLAEILDVESSIRVVKEKSALRRVIASGQQMIESALVGEKSVEDILSDAEKGVMQLSESSLESASGDTMEAILGAFPSLDEYLVRDMSKALWSPWPSLNQIAGPWLPEELIIFAARPGNGKSVAAGNIATHNAAKGKHVILFNYEMSRQQVIDRMLAGIAWVDSYVIKCGKAKNPDMMAKLRPAWRQLVKMGIRIPERPPRTISALHSYVRRVNADRKVDLVICDYLQLMTVAGKKENRTQEIGAVSRGLKGIATDFKCPVIALAQLNRGVEQRKAAPELMDLRESGDIEQDASLVVMHHRPALYMTNPQERQANDNLLEMYVRKNRGGSIGMAPLFFRKEFNRIDDLTSESEEQKMPKAEIPDYWADLGERAIAA
jgi:replicative DNA helicase